MPVDAEEFKNSVKFGAEKNSTSWYLLAVSQVDMLNDYKPLPPTEE